jgi:hypothetical protein
VAIDRDFASAWQAVSIEYGNLRQEAKSADAIERAYALRDTVGERERLHIMQMYHTAHTQDIDAAIDVLTTWTTVYPLDAVAWANLSNAQNWLGRYDAAIVSGRRAVALDDKAEGRFAVLLLALMHAGRLDEAKALFAQAEAKGVAGELLHVVAYQLACARSDRAEMDRIQAWAKGKPAERRLMVEAAFMAYAEGQAKAADALDDQAAALGRSQGLDDNIAATRALNLWELGYVDRARAVLAATKPDWDPDNWLYDQAVFGDAAKAQAALTDGLSKRATDTLFVGSLAPSVRAALLARSGHAAEAVAAARAGQSFGMIEYSYPYQVGYLMLAAHDPAGAAAQFRDILANPGRRGNFPEFTLARLGLARALRMEGDLAGARREYAAFLARWAGADADAPLLAAARQELAALPAGARQHAPA